MGRVWRGRLQILMTEILQTASTRELAQHFRAVSLEDEAAPATYRKICLNGRPLLDKEPTERDRSDQELEQTAIDALTLQLRHQTTDIYVPLQRSDFALAVRRNVRGMAWLKTGDLLPTERPDIPFGNCWTSGIAASIHVAELGETGSPIVHVTDEQGTIHRFVAESKGAAPVRYHPLPRADHEQESAAMSLMRDAGDQWVFQRKFGTTLLYDQREIIRNVHIDGRLVQRHRFYRLVSVTDSRGVRMAHVYHPGNEGLVPDEITFHSRRIRIERNAAGRVVRLIDPRGHDFLFHYRQSNLPGGAPLLIKVEKAEVAGSRRKVLYEYDETVEQPKGYSDEFVAFHTNLRRIVDPLGNTYDIEYAFDHSRIETVGGIDRPAPGVPRCVSKTVLPSGLGAASFINYSAVYADSERKSRRVTFVADAVGNGRIYDFLEPQLLSMAIAGRNPPRLAVFRQLRITHLQGTRHRLSKRGEVKPAWPSKAVAREMYEFDLEAGMALAKAVDLSGNVTQFLHEDTRPVESVSTLFKKHADPTARINALGGIRRFKYEPPYRLLVEREDELGRITVFTREPSRGLLLAEAVYESRQALARKEPFTLTEFEYSDSRFPAFVTRRTVRKLPRPRSAPAWEQDLVTEFGADELGEIACEIKDPAGLRRITRFAYDLSSNKLSIQYPDGFFVQFRYDALNQLIRVYRPRQYPKRIYFDGRGNKIREVAPNGEITLYEWDALSRNTKKVTATDAYARIKQTKPFRHNAVGTLVFNPNVNGESRTLAVDALQRLVKAQFGNGAVVRYAYQTNCGSLLFEGCSMDSTRARRNQASPTFWKYDKCCRKIEERVGLQTPAFFQYDAVGNLIVEVDRSGGWTRYEYDALNRRVKTIRPNGKVCLTIYTSTGLEYESVNTHGDIVEKRYDSTGEVVEEDR